MKAINWTLSIPWKNQNRFIELEKAQKNPAQYKIEISNILFQTSLIITAKIITRKDKKSFALKTFTNIFASLLWLPLFSAIILVADSSNP